MIRHTIVGTSFIGGPKGRGYLSRDYRRDPMMTLKTSAMATMTKGDILDAIHEKTQAKSWIKDKCDRAGLKVKNQGNSSYCWIHAPVHGMEVYYVLLNGQVKILSAFYAGANIKGGRNQGGSGITGIKYLVANGTCLETMHGAGNFKVDNNPDNIANAKLHQITAYEDIDPRDKLAIWTRIVNDIPVTVGIPAWSHEVLLTSLTADGDNIHEGFDNSWAATWGDNGRGILMGNKAIFDEAGSILSVEPASN